jgi:lipopolysaccharide/colanic/teichoic acid biosynthesis glycosyltransferase
MKRLFDVIVAGLGLILLSPLIAAVAIVVRYKLGSPILFVQSRPGLGGRLFHLVKFRTMTDARGREGTVLPDEQRLTSLGIVMRNTSLDELPQLWNVLKGDMSLVGPRPLLPQYLPRYTENQRRRHEVRPGITGWAQVNGRNASSWEHRLALDTWYVDHANFLLDLRILLATLLRVLHRDGISQTGHATMPEFSGSDSIVRAIAGEHGPGLPARSSRDQGLPCD